MKLMTKEIENKLNKFGLNGQENLGLDSIVLVKYFNPYGQGTWLITGGEKQSNGDWAMFGYISILHEEWGYVLLSELESLRLVNDIPLIERDLYLSDNATVKSECDYLNIAY